MIARPSHGIATPALRFAFVLGALLSTAPALHAQDVPPAAVATPGQAAGDAAPESSGGDLSAWLLDGPGVLPVPIIMTDPALGNGGGVVLVRLRRSGAAPKSATQASETKADAQSAKVEPNVYGVGVFRTSNGSSGYGAGMLMRFRDDALRYSGVAAHVSMNLEYHLPDARQPATAGGIAYNIDGFALSQGMQFRMGSDRLYGAVRWVYTNLGVSLHGAAAANHPQIADRELSRRNSGLALSMEYDSRDSMFTASRGSFASVSGTWYRTALGSDSDFQLYDSHGYVYLPLGEDFVLGGRADLRVGQGDVPFYRLPYIDLRGIGAARYQDTRALTLETELRWNFARKWALVGFGGAGRAWGRHGGLSDVPTHAAKGAGIRYLLSSELGLYVGVDYARGPEDGAYYVQVGSAWQ